MAVYDLGNELDRMRCQRRVDGLMHREAVVSLEERAVRTGDQNNYLHLLIRYVAACTGVSFNYCKENYYKKAANADLYVRQRHDPFLGLANVPVSSATLTKEEMSRSIDRFRRWALLVAGVPTPDPDNEMQLDGANRYAAHNDNHL